MTIREVKAAAGNVPLHQQSLWAELYGAVNSSSRGARLRVIGIGRKYVRLMRRDGSVELVMPIFIASIGGAA